MCSRGMLGTTPGVVEAMGWSSFTDLKITTWTEEMVYSPDSQLKSCRMSRGQVRAQRQ